MLNLEKRLSEMERKLDLFSSASSKLPSDTFRSADDQVDLLELVGVLWRKKVIILCVTAFVSLCSMLFSLSIPNTYKAETILAPTDDNSGGNMASIASQLGGLASFAGVSLGGRSSNKTMLAVEILQSRKFISQFLNRHNLLVPLMAVDRWDSEKNELVYSSEVYDVSSGEWVDKPREQKAIRVFRGGLIVSVDKKTEFVSLSFEHSSPHIAKTWVALLVNDINDEIKKRDVSEARKSIKFLKEQLGKTSIADMQAIFFELIEEQTKTIMFAEVRSEYVFKTIDPPVVPDLKFKPKRSYIVLTATFVAGLLMVVLFTIRFLILRDRSGQLEAK